MTRASAGALARGALLLALAALAASGCAEPSPRPQAPVEAQQSCCLKEGQASAKPCCGEGAKAPATGEAACCESQAAEPGAQSVSQEPEEAAPEKQASAPEEAATAPAEGASGPAYVTRGALPLDPIASGIGQVVSDVSFTDLAGQRGSLHELAKSGKGVALIFTSRGCPVTKAYAPQLSSLVSDLERSGVAVLVVDPAVMDEPAALRAWAKQQGWGFRLTRDPDYAFCQALGARRTADAFLLDAEARLRYRGPIDDQYGINYRLEAPRTHHLRDAVAALVAGHGLSECAFEAPGCKITRLKLD